MNKWEEKQIKDLATAFSGYAFSSSELVNEGIPVLKIGNIDANKVSKDTDSYYSGSITDKLSKYLLGNDDFLIAMTGAGSVGKPGKMFRKEKEYLVNQRVAIVRNNENADGVFLYYWFTLPFVERYLYSLGIGAGQPNISAKDIFNIKLKVPDLPTQKRIAGVLSTYDDLIENNNKRIALLEKAAQELYKEWFVRFRFPKHETAEFKNGIPKDWEYVKLGEVLSFERGISYSSDEIDCDDGVNLINLKNIEAFGGFRRDGTKKYNGKYRENQVVLRNDLVLGVTDMTQDRRTVGAVALIPTINGTSVISADLVKVISDIPNQYLYCLCKYGFYSKYFAQFANGANVLHLKPNTLLNKKLLLPTKELIDAFVKKVSVFIELADKLNLDNDNLIKQRDLLLPRLMSGKLEV